VSGPVAATARPAGPDHPAAAQRARVAAAPTATPRERSRFLDPALLGFALAVAAIVLGYRVDTERYLSPEAGLGYALGIAGGSAMLLLLLYPARKRLRWIGFLGSVKSWFRAHMVLGVVGPILILYHSNFRLGATNSNAALFAMLTVAASGVFGRYFYTRIHFGLYGHRASRAELQAAADALRERVAGSKFVPDLLRWLDEADARLLDWKAGSAPRLLVRPFFVTLRMYRERWRIARRADAELRTAAAQSPAVAAEQAHFRQTVHRYIERRLDATRRVAEFESYERLFALWHVLHLPLFFMLLIAGVVHVIAVHVY
jgi:hypothetical protein